MKTASKVALAVISVLLIAATIAIALTCVSDMTKTEFGSMLKKTEQAERTTFGRPMFGTDADKPLDITMPAEDDLQGQKELAYYLYDIANKNHQNLQNVAIFYDCVTTTRLLGQDMNAKDYRFAVKDGDKFFYSEYSFAEDAIGEGMLGAFSPESTLFAWMRYTDATMDSSYTEKIVYPTPTRVSAEELKAKAVAGENVTVPVEGQIFNVDWSSDDLRIGTFTEKPYYSGQDGQYEATGQKIRVETMQSAKVTYNKEEGYYLLEIQLDVDNPITTEDTLSELREGFGNDTAHYTTMTETIEIWDNGYFKNFLSVDCWTGNKVINLDFILAFDMHYCYFGDALDMNNYQYATDFIARAKNK